MRPGAGDGAEGEAQGTGDVEAGEGAGAGLGGGPLGGEGEGRREDHGREGSQGDEDRVVRAGPDAPQEGEGGGVTGAAQRERLRCAESLAPSNSSAMVVDQPAMNGLRRPSRSESALQIGANSR